MYTRIESFIAPEDRAGLFRRGCQSSDQARVEDSSRCWIAQPLPNRPWQKHSEHAYLALAGSAALPWRLI